MKKVLVTGGAGYIGSHACKMLSARGFRPVCFDNLVYGHEEAVKWGPFYRGDLLETKKLEDLIEKESIQAVLHFAAYAYVGESVQNPMKYYQNNVAGTLSLLEACLNKKVHRLVFSSTCATYGVPSQAPISETAVQNPINPYGRSKLMIEQILQDVVKATPMKAVALRYFNAAGADLSGEIGEDHDPETHLIPLTLQAALDPSRPLTIFGNDYPTVDGTCVRDYVHVTDLADAHVLAIEKMESLPEPFSAFNLGTGQGYSVAQILKQAEITTGRKIPHTWGSRRPGDPPVLVAGGSRSQEILGWRPQHSDLETILRSAWAWHQNHGGKK